MGALCPLLIATVLGISVHQAAAADFRRVVAAWHSDCAGPYGKIEGPLEIEAVEQQSLVHVKGSPCPQVVFGCAHDRWGQFKKGIRDGDALFFVRCSGAEGYLIIRGEKVVNWFWTVVQ